MRAMIQVMHENNYHNLTFPSKEKELLILCYSLGVANTAKTEVEISTVHNDERLSALLSHQTVNLDELNFLMKRLDSFDQNPYAPIPPGIEGTVDFVDDIGTLHCNFDNGRSLGVIVGEDSFTVIKPEEEQGMNLTMR